MDIETILELHIKWLMGAADGVRANLIEANLMEADLRGANLMEADLRGANLRGVDLRGATLMKANLMEANLMEANLMEADLRGANLRGVDLEGANLREANLREANFRRADLEGANLREAFLMEADLREANLIEADLKGAKLRGADLRGADLRGAKNIPFIAMCCPDTGSYIGYKKAEGLIIKLEITADALRSSATGRKCRASKAKVLDIEYPDGTAYELKSRASSYDPNFIYTVGEIVSVDNFDTNRWNECAPGIHHFINRQEAVDYFI